MRHDNVLCLGAHGFHRMHYTDWGDPWSHRLVLCVHGLTRLSRDFDFLARALAPRCRVVCPDIVGRGGSDWLTDSNDYVYPNYLPDLNALLARVSAWPVTTTWLGRAANFLRHRYGSRSLYWVGTSMGGILGMLFAALPGSPVRKLVVNDIGPLIPQQALERIARFVGDDPRFDTYEELEAYQRKVSASFGPLSDAEWRHLILNGSRQHRDGKWGLHYDPGIAVPFRRASVHDIDLWPQWDAITCPTLVLRGAESDLLLKETAQQMQRRGPRAKVVEFAGIGHAPMLLGSDQISVVREFLLAAE